jgi:predicted Fe-Mo cluster-binding NifX family protein
MIVMVPLVADAMNLLQVATDFRIAEIFGLWDSEISLWRFFNLQELVPSGTTLVEALIRIGVQGVVTRELRPLALSAFTDAGICCYTALGNDPDLNMKFLGAGSLPHFSSFSAKIAGCASGTCGECDSTCMPFPDE